MNFPVNTCSYVYEKTVLSDRKPSFDPTDYSREWADTGPLPRAMTAAMVSAPRSAVHEVVRRPTAPRLPPHPPAPSCGSDPEGSGCANMCQSIFR